MLQIHSAALRPHCLHLTLEGRLDAAQAQLLARQLTEAAPDIRSIVLDCSGLDYLSSAGLRAVLLGRQALAARGGALVLCSLPPFVQEVVTLSGLGALLRILPDVEQALALCDDAPQPQPWTRDLPLGRLACMPLPPPEAGAEPCRLETWDHAEKGQLFQASLAELGLSLGRGGFGTRREQALDNRGLFLSCLHAAALLPDGAPELPDFMTTRYPSETVIFVERCVGLGGDPALFLELQAAASAPLGQIMALADATLTEAGHPPVPEAWGLSAALLCIRGLRPSAQDCAPAPGALALCLACPLQLAEDLPPSLAALPWRRDGELSCCTLALTLDTPATWDLGASLAENLARLCRLEQLVTFAEIGPETLVEHCGFWVWRPLLLRSARERRMQVQWPPGQEPPDPWDVLLRRIYADPDPEQGAPAAARVQLTPLSGGYSSANFIVESFDAANRRLLPTVLKLGPRALIRQELQAWHEHVRPFILNNAAVLTGHAQYADQGGICYNLLGLDGEASRLSWLEQHYLGRSTTELLPLFERLLTRVLKPWYGQPRWDSLALWQEHDPTPRFPDILRRAAAELDLGPERATFDSVELGRELPNPYRILAELYPQRRAETRQWYSCVVHGDLNLRNVLLDERENIHVIDFSETRRGNALSDFARLEVILLLEHTRLDAEQDAEDLAHFLQAWYKGGEYAAPPVFAYTGSDPRVGKAFRLLQLVRRCAETVTLFETDLTPYYLALLQWTLPTVCFRDWSPERKRLAATMSGLLCERLTAGESFHATSPGPA